MGANKNMTMHIDKWVIYLFLGVFLISSGAFAFRYSKESSCDEVLFSIEAKEYRVGELIKFKDESVGAENWKWEFGDSTTGSTQNEPLHIFEKEGEYVVRLLVNGFCEKTETVMIKEKLIVIDSTKIPVFKLPESIRVGQTLRVKDETENADSWEWRFGENASVDADTKRAEYVYETDGLKTVRLIVNGDEVHVANRKINVIPLEGESKRLVNITEREAGWNIKSAPKEQPKVEVAEVKKEVKTRPKAGILISDANFKRKLLLIADEKIKPQAFSEYLCGNLNLPIVVEGRPSTFLLFCEKIKGKKIKIKSLDVIRVQGSNCITNITVEWRRTFL